MIGVELRGALPYLMTVAFVLIGRLAQLQVFDTFDLEKKNLLQVQVDENYNRRAVQSMTVMASLWR